jgi:hypothetical protein
MRKLVLLTSNVKSSFPPRTSLRRSERASPSNYFRDETAAVWLHNQHLSRRGAMAILSLGTVSPPKNNIPRLIDPLE